MKIEDSADANRIRAQIRRAATGAKEMSRCLGPCCEVEEAAGKIAGRMSKRVPSTEDRGWETNQLVIFQI